MNRTKGNRQRRRSVCAGFIVINEMLAAPLNLLLRDNCLWKGVIEGGILLVHEGMVTVFPNKRAALNAVDRTKEYFDRPEQRKTQQRNREADEYTIRRLVPCPDREGSRELR